MPVRVTPHFVCLQLRTRPAAVLCLTYGLPFGVGGVSERLDEKHDLSLPQVRTQVFADVDDAVCDDFL